MHRNIRSLLIALSALLLALSAFACGDDDNGNGNGGGSSSDAVAVQVCDKLEECGFIEPSEADACVPEITNDHQEAYEISEACGDAWVAADQCMAQVSCSEFFNEDSDACAQEFEAEDAACFD